MSSILTHKWGVSKCVDHVWSHAVGMRTSKAHKALWMVFQAAIDESEDDDIFAVGGLIASTESWVKFTADWEELLPMGTLRSDVEDRRLFTSPDKEDRYHFKMSEMRSPERFSRLAPFYKTIENHCLLAISCAFYKSDFAWAKQTIIDAGHIVDWGDVDDHYAWAFRGLMDSFHRDRLQDFKNLFPNDEPIDFIFDQGRDVAHIMAAWNKYIEHRDPAIRPFYGKMPRFDDDQKFLPIQAADLWVWWIRKWSRENGIDKLKDYDFLTFMGDKNKLPRVHYYFTKDELVQLMLNFAKPVPVSVKINVGFNFSP